MGTGKIIAMDKRQVCQREIKKEFFLNLRG
jgi:hypothetical protein